MMFPSIKRLVYYLLMLLHSQWWKWESATQRKRKFHSSFWYFFSSHLLGALTINQQTIVTVFHGYDLCSALCLCLMNCHWDFLHPGIVRVAVSRGPMHFTFKCYEVDQKLCLGTQSSKHRTFAVTLKTRRSATLPLVSWVPIFLISDNTNKTELVLCCDWMNVTESRTTQFYNAWETVNATVM